MTQTRSSDELKYLVHDSDELQKALQDNPSLINEQDDEGKTLLHYAASLGLGLGSSYIAPILNVLFKTPNIDFNVKDN